MTNQERIRKRLLDHLNVWQAKDDGRLEIVYGDLLGDISGLCEGVDAVIHCGAKTFVDHSIRDPGPFFEANTIGTYRLIEEARRQGVKKFIQVSTDEVYGSILEGAYDENAPVKPTNPYSASKAAADAIVQSYAHAFKMDTVITRTENNYGPYQHPQKAIPVWIRAAIKGDKLPIYGNGLHRRQWLWVEDHVDALLLLLKATTTPGDIYHVAGNEELPNIELACRIIEDVHEYPMDADLCKLHMHFIDDTVIRPGHDRRYALDSTKIRKLGWKPRVDLEDGLALVVHWHKKNPGWM